MRRYLFLVLFICAAAVLPASSSVSAQSCQPPGYLIGPGNPYNHIANGQPKSMDCWSSTTVPADLVTTTDCGSSPKKSFEFDYLQDSVEQTFTVPADLTWTNFELSYRITMNDPHNDGWWTRLRAIVYDVTMPQSPGFSRSTIIGAIIPTLPVIHALCSSVEIMLVVHYKSNSSAELHTMRLSYV
jgi:hypothetical protein